MEREAERVIKEPEKKTGKRVRSDRKIDIKPCVEYELYECISRLSHITGSPMKTVGETICKKGLYTKIVIDNLAIHFRRDYRFRNTVFMGNKDLLSERRKKTPGIKPRVSMRFDQRLYDDLAELAYSLDTTISNAAALLLKSSIQNTNIVNEYISKYVQTILDPERKKQLELVLAYIQKDNPYEADEASLSRLIGYIMDEFMEKSRNVKKAVETWLDQFIEKD
ncbi:hypothetical protein MKZ08_18145 [Viridibacillus sp. FSL R5-0477]|uniref:Uncharacterized protein n=2 Tax=Viridibacillus TaxID=496496 RepID=W4F0M3_9BACL|nr:MULTISPECIES: hypothetical protein [Viridibacillus]ETT85984.1 hypothetical protein C176_09327 [Viridibacillus arenosi FSL R5-213]